MVNKNFLTNKIGIIGGGQLGKMLLNVSSRMNLDTYVLDPSSDCPCSNNMPDSNFTKGNLMDFETVYEFGMSNKLDVITTEIEHINTDALRDLEKNKIKVYPYPQTFEIIQDKNTQKDFFISNSIPTAHKELFSNLDDLKIRIKEGYTKFPFILKSCRHGYDGRGVRVIKNLDDLRDIKDHKFIVEDMIDIYKEISIIVARNLNKEITTYFPIEMHFDNNSNQLDYTIYPSEIEHKLVKEANLIAKKLATKLDLIGIMAIEMFITKNNELLVNELAPRPHNSGHNTIENSYTSQFEQHIRAILNLPLGNTNNKFYSYMMNIIGDKNHKGEALYKGIEDIVKMENTYIHIYGKKETFPNRKMGHINILYKERDKLDKDKINKILSLLKVVS